MAPPALAQNFNLLKSESKVQRAQRLARMFSQLSTLNFALRGNISLIDTHHRPGVTPRQELGGSEA